MNRNIDRTNPDGYSDERSTKLFDNQIERKWLTTTEAAHFLRLSENAVRIMVCRGQIQHHKIGRRLRFTIDDCMALIEKKGA
jgi:excisionase family DNA binding protein